MWHRTQKNVVVNSALLEDLRQRSGVAETINVEAGPGDDAELLFEVALCVETVADERFTRRDVAIRLHPPTTNDAPTTFLDPLLNLGKHSRIRFLHPLVESGGTGDEGEVWIFFHPVEGGAKTGFDLVEAFLPLP